MKCRIVVFNNGRRIEKTYDDHHDAAIVARKLKAKGVRYRLVLNDVLRKYQYPPLEDNIEYLRGEGLWWCPYCREWSYFRVPKFTPGAPIWSEAWILNSFHRQGLKICSWCRMSEAEFYVKHANGIWNEKPRRRRRKRRVR